MTRVLGCDPGLTGAIALIDTSLDLLVAVCDAPTAIIQVGKAKSRCIYQDATYANLIRDLSPDVMVIELVNGLTGQSASASFSFGAGFGLLRGIAAGLSIPVSYISPAAWRAKLHVPKGKDGSRARAGQLFPRQANLFARVKDDGRSDAVLIALAYARDL